MPKRKADVDPVKAVPESPRSSMPDRVAVRLDGITFLVPLRQVQSFRARYAHPDLAPDAPDRLDKTTAAL